MLTSFNNVAIVILNWNGRQYLEKFLPSVIEFSEDAAIWVVDNASTDDSVAYVNAEYPDIKTIVLDDNYGFCGGYNRGLKDIDSKYYVLLNSDVEVSPKWLYEPIQILETKENAAICQPKILSYHNKNIFEYAGAAGGFLDVFGYPFCRGRVFDTVEKDHGQYNSRTEILWASGAAMFIKSEVYHGLGGLDEIFFAHMEEIDMCWRANNAGYSVHFAPNSVVYHVGGGTLSALSPFKTFLNFRNGLRLLYKNLPKRIMLPIIFLRMILDGVAGIRFLTLGEPKHFLAIIKAHFSFYSTVHKLKRFPIRRNTFNDDKLVCAKPTVLHYFVLKRKTYSELYKS